MNTKKPIIIIFHGTSGTGKTTLIQRLSERCPDKFTRLVTCTSRKIRGCEVDGTDYHFVDKTEFENRKDLILVNVSSEGHYYGTQCKDLSCANEYLLGTFRRKGILFLDSLGYKIILVKLLLGDAERQERMTQRGDPYDSIQGRLISEMNDSEQEDLTGLPDRINSLTLSSSLEKDELVDQVLKFLELR